MFQRAKILQTQVYISRYLSIPGGAPEASIYGDKKHVSRVGSTLTQGAKQIGGKALINCGDNLIRIDCLITYIKN